MRTQKIGLQPALLSNTALAAIVLEATLLATTLTGCDTTPGPPDADDAKAALADHFAHLNERGGIRIQLGSIGSFRHLRFDVRLHHVTLHGCTGRYRVYVCDITYLASFPPVKEETESIRTRATLFDGPGGWRLIE